MFSAVYFTKDFIQCDKLITSCDCNGILAFGYSDGIVKLVFDINDSSLFTFVAFNSQLSHMCYSKTSGNLIFCGSDEDSQLIFRICDLTFLRCKLHESGPVIKIIKEVNLFNINKNKNVTEQHVFPEDSIISLSISPCSSLATVATKSHGIYVYKNYLINGKNASFFNIEAEKIDNKTINWLYVLDESILYVATELAIFEFKIDSKVIPVRSFIPPPSWGPIRGCIYFDNCKLLAYGDRIAFVSNWKPIMNAMDCKEVHRYKNYLIVTTSGGIEVYYISGYIKFTAFNLKMENPLSVICTNNGFIVVGENTVSLKEKNINDRIEYLITKRKYKLALEICTQEDAPKHLIEKIYQRHADILFQIGQVGQATKIYSDNANCLESSLIISKLSYSRNLHWLLRYLIALHEKGLSKPRHTSILFQIFAHLYSLSPSSTGLASEMKNFLSKFGDSHSQAIYRALEACRRSVSIDFVKEVAKLQSNHSLYLDILINDIQDYSAAVEYLKDLSIPDSCSALLQYGKVLTRHSDDLINLVRKVLEESSANLDVFTPLFLSNNNHLKSLVDSDDIFSDSLSSSSFSALMDAFLKYKADDVNKIWKLLNQNVFDESHLQIALVLAVFHNFVDGIECIATKMRCHSFLFAINSDKISFENVESDPVLWSEKLVKIVKMGKFEQVEQYLEHHHKSISLPNILNILEKNEKLPLWAIKKFLYSEFKKLKVKLSKTTQELQQHKVNIAENVAHTPMGKNGQSEDEFFKFLNGAHDPVEFVSQQIKLWF